MVIDEELFERQVERQQRKRRRSRLAFAAGVAFLMYVPSIGVLLAFGVPKPARYLYAVPLAPVLTAVVLAAVGVTTRSAGGVFQRILHPPTTGMGPPPVSHAEALAKQGRFDESIAAFEALRARHGEVAHTLRVEAEIHLGRDGQPARARDLLVRLRKAADATPQDELYATQRLIDLYFGPLQDEARALTEMRRLVHRFPGTRDAMGAQQELDRRKSST